MNKWWDLENVRKEIQLKVAVVLARRPESGVVRNTSILPPGPLSAPVWNFQPYGFKDKDYSLHPNVTLRENVNHFGLGPDLKVHHAGFVCVLNFFFLDSKAI